MNQNSFVRIKLLLEKEIKYRFLLLKNFYGLFDYNISNKLEYFKKTCNLKNGHALTQAQFYLFIDQEIERSKQSLTSLAKERDYNLMTIIFSILIILVLLGLFINLAISFRKIFSIAHYWLLMSVGLLLISVCILIFVWYVRRINTSNNREVTLNRYQSILKELHKNKQDAIIFMRQMESYDDTSRTKIDLTPAQLVAFLSAMLKNIVISTPYNYKELTQFFEERCQQSNGAPYQNLQVLLSQYKNEDRDSEPALQEGIRKMTK